MLLLVTGPPGTGKTTVAEAAASELGAAVLGWDWAMSALRGFDELQSVIEQMPVERHRSVGWTLLFRLARAQLRAGRPVVLDGVARQGEATEAARLAGEAGARLLLVVTRCSDLEVHRSRIEGRERHIPGWYELEWGRVRRSLDAWEPPASADLELDAADPLERNLEALRRLLAAAP